MLSLDELEGLNPRPNWQIRNFPNVVDECRFTHLGWNGHKFMCTNNHDNEDTYGEARGDRAFATKEWTDLVPFALVAHIVQ